jgi:uncharacterized protein with HEPN domain
MLDEPDYLLGESGSLSREQFLRDDTLRRAFVRSIEIIGEAAKGVPKSFRDKYPDVPWQSIAGMRDRLIHGYFAVGKGGQAHFCSEDCAKISQTPTVLG